MNIILNSFYVLMGIGVISAIVLFFIAKKFYVVENPLIDTVAECLPGANCGGCGFAGCRNFAESIVNAGNLDGFNCPPGGNETMANVAKALGMEAIVQEPKIAVVRCSGSRQNAPQKTIYNGAKSCAIASSLYAGESGCPNGCLGLGDCVSACLFDSMYIDNETGLAVVVDNKCVGCGACVTACPRNVIELRLKGKKDRRIFVSCINKEKGAIAKKNCQVACIACKKCEKVCAFGAITIENNCAYIDSEKCKLCRKCTDECPTGAIIELNFPAKKVKKEEEAEVSVETNNEIL